MPKNKISDPITDQEMAFVRLVLSGGMTDRHAAEAVGLKADSAAYIKSKPHVRAYMLEHRAAVQQQLVQQEADLSRLPRQAVGQAVDGLHRLDREQVLARLWEIANLSPEMTRGSIAGQVKALSMIVAMQNLIPDRKAVSEKKSPAAAWSAGQQATTIEPQPSPGVGEAPPACPARPGVPWSVPRDPVHSQSIFANRLSPSQTPSLSPYVPLFDSVPDLGVGFSIKKDPFNPFVHPR